MRAASVLLARLSLLCVALLTSIGLGSGCTKATVIGTACKVDGDCNVAGQVCAPGFGGGATICTKKCTGQTGPTGCPIGYDCFPTDAAKGNTCTKALYEVDAKTGKPLLFGKDCSLDASLCASAGSSNAKPSCRLIPDTSADPPVPVENDPSAYCTGSCENDTQCPLDFVCATDYDMEKKCLRRRLCTDCTVDANCPTDFPVCVPTKDGKSRYCTKPCVYRGDCGGVQNSALTCAETMSAAGTPLLACLHRFGACVGEGNICDPCRTKADCAKSNSTCASNDATGERFCTKQCKVDTDCTSAAGSVKTACDTSDLYDKATNPNGMSIEICNGDIDHVTPGLYSCWFPE